MLRWLLFVTICVLLPCCYSIIVAPPHQSKPLASFNFDEIINDSSPHIGFVNATTTARSLEVFVIGTSHFICNSAQEVTQLIEQVQPDGVVLELDPERVIRLSKRFVGFDAFGNSIGDGKAPEDMLYGADFFAAINTCQLLDIPMFLGDEYVQETTQRNKFYSAVSVNGSEGRYADVIFEADASYAQIIEIKEGKRAVSGDRKVNVLIEGGDSFVVDASHISISNHGYMVASQTTVTDCNEVDRPESGEKKIRLVVVVGTISLLSHLNP
jgi:hypothetical protein